MKMLLIIKKRWPSSLAKNKSINRVLNTWMKEAEAKTNVGISNNKTFSIDIILKSDEIVDRNKCRLGKVETKYHRLSVLCDCQVLSGYFSIIAEFRPALLHRAEW